MWWNLRFVSLVFDVLLYSKKVHTHASRKAGAFRKKKYAMLIYAYQILSIEIDTQTNKKWMKKKFVCDFQSVCSHYFFSIWRRRLNDVVWIWNEWLCTTTNLRSFTHNNKNGDQFFFYLTKTYGWKCKVGLSSETCFLFWLCVLYVDFFLRHLVHTYTQTHVQIA